LKVLVLMGGISAEREISLMTGGAVARGLSEAGHDVSTFGLSLAPARSIGNLVSSTELIGCDVVFIALHGGQGEDGRIQALLDLIDKPYTGSGPLSSGLCMDKALSKMVFEHHGIPTPAWFATSGSDGGFGGRRVEKHMISDDIETLGGYPVVVKPVDQGSTIGVSIVKEASGLAPAIALAERYARRLIFERYIPGRELSVAIVGEQVFPVIEIVPEDGFYDYERKYTKGKSSYHCPADIDGALSEQIRKEAFAAYKALGCEGFARVDLRLGDDGAPYFLEINTVPGMTETSLVPMAAAVGGYSFSELVDMIVEEALRRPGKVGPETGG
jgi:D-alanine-D-alanine ligase